MSLCLLTLAAGQRGPQQIESGLAAGMRAAHVSGLYGLASVLLKARNMLHLFAFTKLTSLLSIDPSPKARCSRTIYKGLVMGGK